MCAGRPITMERRSLGQRETNQKFLENRCHFGMIGIYRQYIVNMSGTVRTAYRIFVNRFSFQYVVPVPQLQVDPANILCFGMHQIFDSVGTKATSL
jgi:hypothetical protein